jgi:hypothetical protein
MTARADLEHRDALKSEILQAGMAIHRTRNWLNKGLAALSGVAVLISLTAGPFFLLTLPFLGGMAALMGVVFVLALAGYRRLWRQQLRQKLAMLPQEERAAVLLPLQRHSVGDTRKIVAPLVGELVARGTELAPAAPPQGSGTEVAPLPPPNDP